MSHTDLKFFTNEPERDLYSRFVTILRSNTQFFDILVGYFRSSGFFKLYEALEDVEKIRILVGLNVDHFTVKIIDQMRQEIHYTPASSSESKEKISEEIESEFEAAPTTEEVEKGVRIFIDWLKTGKLEMRMYTQAPIHAKVYIMRKNPEKVPDTFGSVITGSSNFSEAGLLNNLEFNVELKDAPDVKFALEKFEELWAKAIDIRDTYIESVEQRTWLRSDITPYQIYLKTLYEFFKEEINADKESFETLLPEGYMRLQYQIDAVTQARQKLEAYNGVFISDVVGLGKTYICAMLANSFNRNTYKLFICPPVLVDYWKSVLQEFDVARCDVESLGKLDKVIAKGTDKYSYIFVDEAHRFRNSDTEAFTLLHQICRDKKVVLISATPINNYTSDIENQLYLFQAKQSGTINGIKNIEGFFRGLNSRLGQYPKGSLEYMKQLRENSEIIRDKLLREVTDIDALEENFMQQRHLLIEARGRLQQEVKDIYTTATSQIRDIGLDAANLLVEGCKQDEVEDEIQKSIRKSEDIIEKCQSDVEKIICKRLNEMGQQLEVIENSEFSRNLKLRLNGKFEGLPEGIKKVITKAGPGFQRAGQAVLNNAYKVGAQGGLKLTNFSGSTIHQIVLKAGHGVGFKFKPWQAIKITKGIAIGGQVLSALGVGLSVFMQIKADHDQEKIASITNLMG